jgi:hypothetical protein
MIRCVRGLQRGSTVRTYVGVMPKHVGGTLFLAQPTSLWSTKPFHPYGRWKLASASDQFSARSGSSTGVAEDFGG